MGCNKSWRRLNSNLAFRLAIFLISQLVDAIKRNPRRAILAVAFISVVVSCYPVLFFGRSFVSANSVPMLYAGIPTVPGHIDRETENFKDSDAGAIMWHEVPSKRGNRSAFLMPTGPAISPCPW
jgi:hypothetical protein